MGNVTKANNPVIVMCLCVDEGFRESEIFIGLEVGVKRS